MESAASRTPEAPGVEMEVDMATAPTRQGSAGQRSPAPKARENEVAPQGGGAWTSTPVESLRQSPQASAGEGLGADAGAPLLARPRGRWCEAAAV